MIYITGDCHGEFQKLGMRTFPQQKEMTKDDYVIVCGDFGIWSDSKEQRYWMNWLHERNFTTLFVDGNHENFDILNALPEEEWMGGKVHYINDSVIHLMRGQIFKIQGYSFFTFGGARSHDIQGGVLDPEDPGYREKARRLRKMKIPYRVDHQSWWKEEMPVEVEFEQGRQTLAANKNKADVIITHCAPTSLQEQIMSWLPADPATEFLEEIHQSIRYQRWFFGHYHEDIKMDAKDMLIYNKIVRVV